MRTSIGEGTCPQAPLLWLSSPTALCLFCYHSMPMPAAHSPLYPVVGVSWFEAEAYTCWLTEHTHQAENIEGAVDMREGLRTGQFSGRLPTAAEWVAAMGGGNNYPAAPIPRTSTSTRAVASWWPLPCRFLVPALWFLAAGFPQNFFLHCGSLGWPPLCFDATLSQCYPLFRQSPRFYRRLPKEEARLWDRSKHR